MKTLRTPEDRFRDLADFPFAPNYLQVDDSESGSLRIHYLDEGPAQAAPVLALHGEPTWCYLYRHMIPRLATAGHRVIAPDLVGFGRSDKPARREDHTYARHVAWTGAVIRQLDLTGITLFCQDWGGLIGLRLWADMPERFARIVVANTALPTGEQPLGEAFGKWRDYSQTVPEFRAGRIVHGGTVSKLTEDEVAAYDAPFPDESYKAGPRQMPLLVPMSPGDPGAEENRAAWRVIRTLDTPVLTAFGEADQVMAGIDAVFQEQCPGAAGQPHRLIPAAGHFLQEDAGDALADLVIDFIVRTR
ncbi:haloalkane dehalogenase [Cribrihabitans marinus]|uniref:Haloalkane dehalogenase n=1 Tax=Cribrihabitans marinus TaxID=1227549 RepID=A0A1H6RCF7_9RHOB|nr:haloalkane dehalogenase [Cribrihabitans marinus]GGH20937.1 haloalkane dehalogenase [Cribrihabitans marinus]SEI53509.1 haloalkane dehalogenase [Cribrihabitans marinus]